MPNPSSAVSLALESAIDSRPLTLSATAPLTEAIHILGKAKSSCNLPGLELSLDFALIQEARASAIFVTQEGQLLGVITEQLLIQTIASGRDFTRATVAEIMQPSISLVKTNDQDVFTALAMMRQHQCQHLPILNAEEQLVGIVTPATLRHRLQLDELLKQRQLADIAIPPVIQAPETASVQRVARLMADHQVDCVVLTAEAEGHPQPVGILLAQNLIQLQALNLNLVEIVARQVMARPLLCFPASESILAAYWRMQQEKAKRFGVVGEDGTLLSIVTPTSFLEGLDLDSMRRTIEQVQQSIEQFATVPHAFAPAESLNPELQTQSSTELLQQLQCSQILTTMALHIRESLDLDHILQTAVDEVRQFLQTDRVIIYRFNPDWSGTVVVESVAEGWRPALNSTLHDTCFGQNYAHEYRRGRTQVTEDIYAAGLSQCHIDILVLYDIRASLVVPILQGNHLWGLLCAYRCSAPRLWRSFEVDLLKQLATHMAIAIQQSELYQQVQTELIERRKAEDQLRQSLKEKEALLKEIHHRVKNNLQVISSVLRLQSDYIKDEQALELFKDSQNRIRSMALIHEKLYQSRDLSEIEMQDYVRDLTETLLRSYAAPAPLATLSIQADDISLNIDTAIPCGLIINELVSNSLKHAFQEAKPENGIIVQIFLTDNNQYTLIVQDNGIGFPETLDFRNTESLGLELVCIFTDQLEGTIELERSQGTIFTITFAELKNPGKVR